MTIAGVRITWLLCLNFVVLQWLTVRMARIYVGERVIGYRLLHGIAPLTGWRSPYRRIWRQRARTTEGSR